jgi:Flp pilus assembly protein TadG
MMGMLRTLSRGAGTSSFARCERGVSVVELAMVLPFLLMLVLGTADIAIGYAGKMGLEQAAQRTTDLALARRPNDGITTYLVQEAASASGQPVGNITVEVYLECGTARQTTFTATCTSGLPARVVSVRIIQVRKLLFDYGKLTAVFGRRLMPNEVTLSGDSIVRIS